MDKICKFCNRKLLFVKNTFDIHYYYNCNNHKLWVHFKYYYDYLEYVYIYNNYSFIYIFDRFMEANINGKNIKLSKDEYLTPDNFESKIKTYLTFA